MKYIIFILVFIALIGFGVFALNNNPKDPAVELNTNNSEKVVTPDQTESVLKTTDANVTGKTSSTSLSTATATNTDTTNKKTPSTAKPALTTQEVAKHNSASSCYTIVRNQVYGVTSFINRHPGGANRILKLCGTDGTEAFEYKHGAHPDQKMSLQA